MEVTLENSGPRGDWREGGLGTPFPTTQLREGASSSGNQTALLPGLKDFSGTL